MRMKLSWRGGRQREEVYLDGGRRTTQLMRDSLGRSTTQPMLANSHEVPAIAAMRRAIGLGSLAILVPGFPILLDSFFLSRLLATGSLPPDWNWTSITVLNLISLAITVFIARSLSALWERFSVDGITIWTWSGRHLLLWRDLRSVDVKRFSLRLQYSKRTLILGLRLYKNPSAVLPYIAEAAPHATIRAAA